MAAASSGEKAVAMTAAFPPQLNFDDGATPQEGTKEHMSVVERYLDELTFCGSAVNDLELQLSSTRASYRKALAECKARLEETRRRLGSCIGKSQPFIDIWRRARQVQEESNRAAVRFDKASSQHAAAKEMIRVTEEQLSGYVAGASVTADERTSDANHALLEVLNHATRKVVETEKEKRESESEHRRVLERCNTVLEEYRSIEKKLRPHIIKSRPFFEERWQCSQQLNKLRKHISGLEEQLQKTKRRYADTLHYLDRLNHSLHQQRSANSLSPAPLASSEALGSSDTESVQSWQVMDGVQFTGSTGSLPSIGSSVADETDDGPLAPPPRPVGAHLATPVINITAEDRVAELARELVQQTLISALARMTHHSP